MSNEADSLIDFPPPDSAPRSGGVGVREAGSSLPTPGPRRKRKQQQKKRFRLFFFAIEDSSRRTARPRRNRATVLSRGKGNIVEEEQS